MTETLGHRYSSESTQRELSNEYQQDRVKMVHKIFSLLMLQTEIALALRNLAIPLQIIFK